MSVIVRSTTCVNVAGASLVHDDSQVGLVHDDVTLLLCLHILLKETIFKLGRYVEGMRVFFTCQNKVHVYVCVSCYTCVCVLAVISYCECGMFSCTMTMVRWCQHCLGLAPASRWPV